MKTELVSVTPGKSMPAEIGPYGHKQFNKKQAGNIVQEGFKLVKGIPYLALHSRL